VDIKLGDNQQKVVDRLSICNDCPNLIKAVQVCKICGCFMPAKVWLMGESCPDDRWVAIEE
jgi:hypothetical protein|tara:strand:- start:114 stop:296 length:183 start_codon:yes stop_codon:yes gene_type:complete